MQNRYILTLFIYSVSLLILPTIHSKEILIVSDEWPQMEVLSAYLQEQGGYRIIKKEQGQIPTNISEMDGVIQFVHGMLNDKPAKQLMDYTHKGGKLLVLHHGVSSKKKQTKGWYEFLGMELDRAEDSKKRYVWIHDIDFEMVNLNPNHYITSNKVTYSENTDYESSDVPSLLKTYPSIKFTNSEVFINHQFIDGREKTVLFGFKYNDSKTGKTWMQDRSGWYKKKGDGLLFYMQPGQIVNDFSDQYCQIILNCFEWKGN